MPGVAWQPCKQMEMEHRVLLRVMVNITTVNEVYSKVLFRPFDVCRCRVALREFAEGVFKPAHRPVCIHACMLRLCICPCPCLGVYLSLCMCVYIASVSGSLLRCLCCSSCLRGFSLAALIPPWAYLGEVSPVLNSSNGFVPVIKA